MPLPRDDSRAQIRRPSEAARQNNLHSLQIQYVFTRGTVAGHIVNLRQPFGHSLQHICLAVYAKVTIMKASD